MKQSIILFASLLALLVVSVGCKKDGLKLAETESVKDSAFVKVGYYSPLPNANFVLKFDTAKAGNYFFYSQLNPSDGTAYLSVPARSGNGKVVLPKVGTIQDSVLIKSFAYDFQKNNYYSIFFLDTGSKVRPLILNDTLDLPAEGKAKVRFVNTMYNVPSADIRLSDNSVFYSGLAFGAATPFIEVNAAQLYGFRFYNPGTTTQLTGTSATTFRFDLTPTNRRIYTIVLRGVAGSSTTAPVLTSITHR